MIKKASTLIVEFWIKNAIIKTDDKESYCYGMELILSTLINVAYTIDFILQNWQLRSAECLKKMIKFW